MAILVEGNVIAVKIEAIGNRFPGGAISFRAFFHTRKAYSDRNLFAISFMSPEDAEGFAIALGIMVFTTNEVAYLSQIQRMVYPVNWIEIKDIEYKNTGRFVRLAYLKGEKSSDLFVARPDGISKAR